MMMSSSELFVIVLWLCCGDKHSSATVTQSTNTIQQAMNPVLLACRHDRLMKEQACSDGVHETPRQYLNTPKAESLCLAA